MKKELIAFKGVTEGIFININSDDFSAIKIELDKKLRNRSKFFQGAKLLGIKAESLSPEDIKELKLILKYKYDLIIEDKEIPQKLPSSEEIIDSSNSSSGNEVCGMTKFFHGTVRSGQVIEYNGHIVIIGDVNPGALIKARGNIIVLGTFRGVAHAGGDKDHNSVVAAYNLQPTQLRIGDMIARPPDEIEGSYKVPEIARIKDGELIIEPYLPNK